MDQQITNDKHPVIEFTKTNENAINPERLTCDSVGYDLFCIQDVSILPNKSQLLDTGIVLLMEPDSQYFPKICDKSSVAWKKHCHVLGGILDPGYRGSIKVILYNYDTEKDIIFKKGDPIAQIVFIPVVLPKLIHNPIVNPSRKNETTRGDRGFGQVTNIYHSLK